MTISHGQAVVFVERRKITQSGPKMASSPPNLHGEIITRLTAEEGGVRDPERGLRARGARGIVALRAPGRALETPAPEPLRRLAFQLRRAANATDAGGLLVGSIAHWGEAHPLETFCAMIRQATAMLAAPAFPNCITDVA